MKNSHVDLIPAHDAPVRVAKSVLSYKYRTVPTRDKFSGRQFGLRWLSDIRA